ncbi:DUF4251 domain-containing protein [Flavobacterium nackdongense]|uniref:DUF4251 domain-containing protein n=1 Tax=Flavobacterium nackdongense TaxID=2547394 RepID=A0A4P6Y610_9FLAO|nr:DUF4251 domain-containing protein [Flavobacterium nackdongense]QBN17689.1 DUF4251 domain-containing protein [Flavobacterium nackdongense]
MRTQLRHYNLAIFVLVLTIFSVTDVFCQEKSKKQLKEEQKLEKQKQIALLVESKEFVFTVERVIPQGGRTFMPTTEYNMEFHPELINSYLPYAGRAFNVGYGGDEGMIFEGQPSVYTVEKTKKAYQIKAEVKGKNDTFSILLTVYFEGNAYLSINSNNRCSISYDGEIEAFKSKDKK